MKTLSENKLRQIIRESVLNILNENKNNSIYNMTFVSYGTDNFDVDNFKVPYFRIDINKPQGGFWGSPINSNNSWGEWCDKEFFHTDNLDKHVLFKIKKNAKIYVIDNEEDLNKISKQEEPKDEINTIMKRFKVSYEEARRAIMNTSFYEKNYKQIMDFNYLYNNFDGIFVTDNAVSTLKQDNNSDRLYWWDVESICVFNPNAIEIIPETEFDKAKIPTYEKDYEYDNDDEFYFFGDDTKRNNAKKQKQINKDYQLYGNQNLNPDSSTLFNGEHPAILAQGHGNNKKTKLARNYNGTIKSGM